MHQPFPSHGEIFELQQAMDECFKNERSNDSVNMSSLIECANGEQTLKLKTMKNKMSIFELKNLVTELLEMVREQNTWIKKSMIQYQNTIRETGNKLMERVEKKWMMVKSLESQISNLKESEERWIRELKDLRVEIELLQEKKSENVRRSEEIQRLKLTINKQKELYEKKIDIIKKESYKTYEQNFDLQQKISSLEDEIEEQKEEFENRGKQQAKQIDNLKKETQNLSKTIATLNSTLFLKDQKIEELKNKLNNIETKNEINNVTIFPAKKKLSEDYHLNFANINKQSKFKNQSKDYSFDRSVKSSRRSERQLKLSIQTIQFMNAKSNLQSSKSSNRTVENPLSPYMVRSPHYTEHALDRSRSKESTLVTSRRLDSRTKPSRMGSKERFDFNLIQLEIDKLKNKLESDLTSSKKLGKSVMMM